ncbi:hypothetical protein Ari01nite_36480 [Paractinoplanes rishiriensis]|uniref:Uncharacterized protein n=1 Tax=Paractinoplanes rishiriensis TaxID=1050105 RepID=A0A919K001_9ACTN|nr:hypothetical protein Ari01nite_36480 [Actinoplanes rishiriensis]
MRAGTMSRVNILRLVRAVITAAAGAVVMLAQLNLPSKEFWAAQELVQWVSVALVAFSVFYDAAVAVTNAIHDAEVRKYEDGLRQAMSATIGRIVEDFDAPWDKVAVYYYLARRVSYFRHLARVDGVRAGIAAAEMEHRFRLGVGIVGVAFLERDIVALEWRDFARAANIKGPQAWERRPARQRYGLTWGQLRRSPPEDGMVASPTYGPDGKPVGCILVCSPLKRATLGSDAMRQILDQCAATLDRLGPPPKGWWRRHER